MERDQLAYALFETNWVIRRWVVFLALGFFKIAIVLILWKGQDTSLNAQAVLALIAAYVTIVMAYVFGAVADDYDKRRTAFGSRSTALFRDEDGYVPSRFEGRAPSRYDAS